MLRNNTTYAAFIPVDGLRLVRTIIRTTPDEPWEWRTTASKREMLRVVCSIWHDVVIVSPETIVGPVSPLPNRLRSLRGVLR
jgi:phosphatidylserine/phosphatidylglycerophosphate/cardiolipin synthase-like enzyme